MLTNKTLLLFIFVYAFLTTHAQSSSDKAIRLKITTQKAPAQIKLSWLAVGGPAPTGTVSSYSVFRKTINATSWGSSIATILPTSILEYVDTNVSVGQFYEYRVIGNGGYSPFGYAYSGIETPYNESEKRVMLLVDSSLASNLSLELERLKNDLIAEGWKVTRHDVSRTASPSSIKSFIINTYNTLGNLKALMIIGHVPVPYSGSMAPDGHPDHSGAWSADMYYGSLDGSWTDSNVNTTSASRPQNRNIPNDGKFDQSTAPSIVDIAVGRVDMFDLPAFAENETTLLKNYLNKNHNFRRKNFEVRKRAFISDNFGYFGGEAFASTGWRNFSTLVSPDSIIEGGSGTFFNMTGNNSFLWAYGCGGGSYTSCGGVGSTNDYATIPLEAVFVSNFGSYFGDWDSSNNFLRAALANSGKPLVNFWAGRPHWVFHQMGMGFSIGESVLATQNNKNSLYNISSNRSIHIALMGDPTLTMLPVSSPLNPNITSSYNSKTLTWLTPNESNIIGYQIYRSESMDGTFIRLTTNAITSTTFTDNAPLNSSSTYAIRTVKLETTASGSFLNYSPAAFIQSGILLPIEILSFNAFGTEAGNTSHWNATYDSDLQNFEIERSSSENYTFEKIGTVPASTSLNKYSFLDQNNFAQTSYYRLKIVYSDRSFEYSKIASVTKENIDLKIKVFPNPTRDFISISNHGPLCSVALFDTYGRNILYKNTLEKTELLDLTNLPNGIYFLQVKTLLGFINQKIAKTE
jgi:hypothetical protein